VQPPGNHQVQHQPHIVLQANADALAHSAQLADDLPLGLAYGWVNRAQQKGIGNPHTQQGYSQDSRLQRSQIGGNVRQLGHGFSLPPNTSNPQVESILHPAKGNSHGLESTCLETAEYAVAFPGYGLGDLQKRG
jgi:hypothetical protein